MSVAARGQPPGGRAGAAFAHVRLLYLDWVRRTPASRAVVVTAFGEQQLLTEFAIKL